MGRIFLAYGITLTLVSLIWYLGRTLSSATNDWLEVKKNLRRARGKWGWLAKILRRGGADKRTAGRFYVAVVQAVLLFGSYMGVLIPRWDKSLEGFHHQAVRWMASMGPKNNQDRMCVYPPIGVELEMVGLD